MRKGVSLICSRCCLDDSVSAIEFDDQEVCNYCHQIDFLSEEYGTGTEKGSNKWKQVIDRVKRSGKGKEFDCVIGVSGGTDSSYLLLLASKSGLRPLAVHYDNTWNTAAAASNIRRVTDALEIPLVTFVADCQEVDDVKRSLFLAGVKEWDMDTDLAFVQVLRKTAAEFGLNYIFEGHSFTAEGLSPIGDNYIDGKYLAEVQKKFGLLRLRRFPQLSLFQFLKWTIFYNQKFIRPLWFVSYSKSQAKAELERETGWVDYGGHHLENRASAFLHQVYLPEKYSIDFRYLPVAAKVRSGEIPRESGIRELQTDLRPDGVLENYVRMRLDLTDDEYRFHLRNNKGSWRDFKTYKKTFRILRPLFYILLRLERIPESFYIKYCKNTKGE